LNEKLGVADIYKLLKTMAAPRFFLRVAARAHFRIPSGSVKYLFREEKNPDSSGRGFDKPAFPSPSSSAEGIYGNLSVFL